MVDIYVDGSYFDGQVGYAAVIIQNGELIKEIYGAVPNEEVQGTRQVAGELWAVGKAIRWCEKYKILTVKIYYDYMGIEMWATGKWKANLDLTKRYKEFMNSHGIRVTFVKVKSHSGNKWNEVADKLAKKGALSTYIE